MVVHTGPPLSLSRIAKLGEPEKGKKPKTVVVVGTVTDDVRCVIIRHIRLWA
jgi:ribosomal protein L18E